MKTLIRSLVIAWSLASLPACRSFEMRTAPGMVELDHQEPLYSYRALSPDGVVLSVRAIDTQDRGNLEFWTRAATLRMHQLEGYALLDDSPAKTQNGVSGRELRFGHDENGKPYLYTIRLFVTKGRLFVVETGGPTDAVMRYKPSLDWMQSTLTVD
jgi:hypothetical protein